MLKGTEQISRVCFPGKIFTFLLPLKMSSTERNHEVTTFSERDTKEYLDFLQEETNIIMIPAFIFLASLIVIGVVGNSLVLLVHWKRHARNTVEMFIMVIAGIDLVTNVLVIPGEIYNISHFWDFRNRSLCRARRFLNAFTTIAAAISLVAVAVVRYRKVCQPFGHQVSVRQCKRICLGIIVSAMVLSIPNAVVNGRHTKDTYRPGIHGYECSIDDSYIGTIWPILNQALFLLVFLCCCVPLIVLYSKIGMQAWKRRKVQVISVAAGHDTQAASESVTSMSFTTSTTRTKQDSLNACTLDQYKRDNEDKHSYTRTDPQNLKITIILQSDNAVSDQTCIVSTESEDQSACSLDNKFSSRSSNTEFKHFSMTFEEEKRMSIKELPTAPFTDNPSRDSKSRNLMTDGPGIYSEQTTETNDRREVSFDPGSDIQREAQSANPICSGGNLTAGKIIGKRHFVNRTTFILVLITVMFIVSFLPYLSLMMFYATSRKQYYNLSHAGLTAYHFFVKFYLLNSAVNPVIYSFCDSRFRSRALRLIKCFSKKRLT